MRSKDELFVTCERTTCWCEVFVEVAVIYYYNCCPASCFYSSSGTTMRLWLISTSPILVYYSAVAAAPVVVICPMGGNDEVTPVLILESDRPPSITWYYEWCYYNWGLWSSCYKDAGIMISTEVGVEIEMTPPLALPEAVLFSCYSIWDTVRKVLSVGGLGFYCVECINCWADDFDVTAAELLCFSSSYLRWRISSFWAALTFAWT